MENKYSIRMVTAMIENFHEYNILYIYKKEKGTSNEETIPVNNEDFGQDGEGKLERC